MHYCHLSCHYNRASIYCDRCHPDVNAEKMKKCHCQRWKLKSESLLTCIKRRWHIARLSAGKHKVPTVKISEPEKMNINGPNAIKADSAQLGLRTSCYANSMNKRFFTERRPSFTTQDHMQLPRKSLSEAVLLQFKRSMSFPADHEEAQLIARRAKPMFDSTGTTTRPKHESSATTHDKQK